MFVIKLVKILVFQLILINCSTLVNLAVIDQNFEVIWNIPSSMCHKYGIKLTNLTNEYGIQQNENDSFRGNVLSILYDPGKFPALLENSSGGLVKRNGGIPQSGNLSEHLDMYRDHLAQLLPNRRFNGLAVIDFESWRPIFRQNFGTLQPYKDLSFKLERDRHWFWSNKQIELEASKQWDHAAPPYMRETLRISQEMFPYAKWGYYGFPYCFNNNGERECSNEVRQENNKLLWLWDNVDAIYPSVYLSQKMAAGKRAGLVGGRVREAKRMAQRVTQSIKPKIYTYLRYCYTDTRKFLTENDWFNAIKEMRREGSDGLIIWGSSNDLNTKAKCQKFKSYIEETLGPIVLSVREPRYSVGEINTSDANK